MIADRLSLAALMAANAFEKARAKRRNIPYTPFAPTKSQLEDWKEVVLAVRATDHSQPEPSPPWRDIESAPRDGTHFLVWDKHYGVRIGRAYVRQDHDDWLSYMDAHKGSSKGGLRATHWMPLPEPPR